MSDKITEIAARVARILSSRIAAENLPIPPDGIMTFACEDDVQVTVAIVQRRSKKRDTIPLLRLVSES